MSVKEINVSDVVFREDLYPRIKSSAVTVQKYAEDLDVLPPIEVNQHNELIDGWHRWTAHKKAEAAKIRATVTKTASEAEFRVKRLFPKPSDQWEVVSPEEWANRLLRMREWKAKQLDEEVAAID